MNRFTLLSAFAALSGALLTGCVSDSISGNGSASYRGELHDYDVIGPGPSDDSDASIRSELAKNSSNVRAVRGSRVLLVQSGAPQPDPALGMAFGSFCDAQPFSGVPETAAENGQDAHRLNSRRLRMAAARSGARSIVVVWGQLETIGHDMDGGLIGALPVVNAIVPTKSSITRLRLKAMIVDTISGRWSTVMSEPLHADGLTTSYGEDTARTIRYEKLKAGAYPGLAQRVFSS